MIGKNLLPHAEEAWDTTGFGNLNQRWFNHGDLNHSSSPRLSSVDQAERGPTPVRLTRCQGLDVPISSLYGVMLHYVHDMCCSTLRCRYQVTYTTLHCTQAGFRLEI